MNTCEYIQMEQYGIVGGKTLLRKGHLGSNLSSKLFPNCVVWGNLKEVENGKAVCIWGTGGSQRHLQ